MPRKIIGRKPKGKLKNWDAQSMMKAIVSRKEDGFEKSCEALRSSSDVFAKIVSVREKKMGLRKAVKLYEVPQTSLQRFVNSDKTPEECVNLKVGRKPVLPANLETELVEYLIEMDDRFYAKRDDVKRLTYLPANLETELVEYLIEMDDRFYGLRRDDVKRLTYQLAVRNNVPHPFLNKTAGRAWFDLFIRRHKKRLTIHKPIGTSFSRCNGFNKDAIYYLCYLFNMLTAAYDKHPYPSDKVFNVDETGLTVVQTKIPHVIKLKGKRQVGAITSAERGSLVTEEHDGYSHERSATGVTRKMPSVWGIQTDLFTEWFQHFLQTTRPSKKSPVLLILDGHNTHTRNLQIIDLARKNHVTIVSIPPHTSHKTQPLDKTFMGPLKTYYSEFVRQFLRHNTRPVGPYDIAELFGKAYLQSGLIAATGIFFVKVTGIYPCDRTVFKDVDVLPSESSSQTEAIPSPDVNIQSPLSTRLQFSDHSSCASTPAAQNDRDAGIPHNPFRLSDVDLQEVGPSNQPTTYVQLGI
ncbi:DDE superfamily endonuclease [Popillia japonica]|uniref:DDE superfamily endonuclease n=1 Tax=Popillia japonica TaxID=7064 RepID=A0AAW1N7L1_POPJA